MVAQPQNRVVNAEKSVNHRMPRFDLIFLSYSCARLMSGQRDCRLEIADWSRGVHEQAK